MSQKTVCYKVPYMSPQTSANHSFQRQPVSRIKAPFSRLFNRRRQVPFLGRNERVLDAAVRDFSGR